MPASAMSHLRASDAPFWLYKSLKTFQCARSPKNCQVTNDSLSWHKEAGAVLLTLARKPQRALRLPLLCGMQNSWIQWCLYALRCWHGVSHGSCVVRTDGNQDLHPCNENTAKTSSASQPAAPEQPANIYHLPNCSVRLYCSTLGSVLVQAELIKLKHIPASVSCEKHRMCAIHH